MSAAFLNPKAALVARARAVVEFEIRNDSAEAWRLSEGFAVGCQIFDADIGAMIAEGPRVQPERDLAPGESARLRLEFEFPPGDGRYQAFLSPMRESVCWYYDRGWPFLLVEAAAVNGTVRLEAVRLTRAAALRRRRAARSLRRAVTLPFQTIWRNRALIRTMVRRDILGRYRGSFAGASWTLINPLLLMLTYFFVFGLVLQTRFPGVPGRTGFALYFLAGMLPWLAFSEAAARAPGIVLEHRNFVRKLVFSIETLPINLVVSGLVSELCAILFFVVFLVLLRGGVPPTALWLPLLLIPQIMFTAGLSWFLAALGVFVRDLGQIIGFLLTVWFFITPICYPPASLSSLPHSATLFLFRNPVYVLVRGYRAVLLDGQAPAFGPLWKLWLLSAAVFILGHAWFYKLRKSFADVI